MRTIADHDSVSDHGILVDPHAVAKLYAVADSSRRRDPCWLSIESIELGE